MNRLKYIKNVSTLRLDKEKCTGCGLCAIVCPHAVFVVEEKKAAIIDRDRCMECGACAQNCPVDAIEVRPGVGCAVRLLESAIKGSKSSCECTGKPNEPCC